jgi:hypothetical protein
MTKAYKQSRFLASLGMTKHTNKAGSSLRGAVVVKEVNLVSAEYIVKRPGLQGAWQEERSRVGYAFLGTRNLPP